ncbi:MAG: dipeptide epimerase [Thermoguttaceae bacterium]|jgi:L-alanine-DL-glutamate epimerase-like enolase superfamily enzyme
MRLTLHPFQLRLRRPFTISRGATVVQPTLVVELEEDGFHGYGEAPDTPYYGASVAGMAAAIEQLRPQIETASAADPEELWEKLCGPSGLLFAQAALDAACWDLWGKRHAFPLWKLWGLTLDHLPPSDYTIVIDTIDRMLQTLDEVPGFPVYKIKLGTPHDLEIVRAVRRRTDAALRVDANCAWSAEETIANSHALAELGVQFIEQPLPADRWVEMQHVAGRSALPLVADESCRSVADVDRCAGCFQGINVKLSKCGGLTPARRMIARARQLGLQVMIGCFTESTVSISAAAQLLPLADYADLDGALLLADDVADGVRIDRGRAVFPEQNGCGVTLWAGKGHR